MQEFFPTHVVTFGGEIPKTLYLQQVGRECFVATTTERNGQAFFERCPSPWSLSEVGGRLHRNGKLFTDVDVDITDLRETVVSVVPCKGNTKTTEDGFVSQSWDRYEVVAVVALQRLDDGGGVSQFLRYTLDRDLTRAEAHAVAKFVRRNLARFSFGMFPLSRATPWYG